MSARSLNWLKFGGLVGLAFGLGLLFAGLLDLPRTSSAQQAAGTATTPAHNAAAPTQQSPPAIPGTQALTQLSDAFAAVAEAVRPSVVFIKASHSEKTAQGQAQPDPRIPQGMEPFFQQRRKPEFEQGSGTGFIVSPDGYIMTNNHVIEGSDKVIVRLLDRREFVAKVVGTDPNTDVAVLKIDVNGLTPATLGDSDHERVGEWVLAIGNPLGDGLTFTVTSGIISAKGRRLDGLQRSNLSIADFLQTDAAINPGNSGGPLVNVQGEVIGMNSAIASETGFYSGYGFAIPINLAHQVMTQLIKTGKVQRAALGIQIAEVTPEDAKYVGLTEPYGVKVADFPSDNSPAAKAGLEVGDIIIAIDGKKVERVGQLQQEVGFKVPGDYVTVQVARKGGVRKEFKIKLQSLSDAQQLADAGAPQSDDNDDAAPGKGSDDVANAVIPHRLGIQAEPLDPADAKAMQLPVGTAGLVITDVVPGGPAFDVGLVSARNGRADILLSVEGTNVKTVTELRNALNAQKPGAIVSLRVLSVARGAAPQRRLERVQLNDTP
jgi:serine protease Do